VETGTCSRGLRHSKIVDVQPLPSPGGLGKALQQGLLLGKHMFLALAPADRLRQAEPVTAS